MCQAHKMPVFPKGYELNYSVITVIIVTTDKKRNDDMARKLVATQDVYEAADEMVRAGKRPTTIGIHRMLGRGSYTTIGNYLKQWEEENEALEDSEPTAIDEDLPASIGKDADLFVRKLWMLARNHENALLQSERDAFLQRESELQEEVQGVVDGSNDMNERIEDLEQELQDSRESHEKEREARIEAERQASLNEAALNRAQTDLAALGDKLDALTGKYEVKLEEVARLNGDVSKLNADVERLNREVDQGKHENERLSQKQANTEASLGTEKSNNVSLERQVRQLQELAEERKAESNRSMEETQRLAGENANLSGQLKERARQMGQLETWLEKALEKVESLKSALNDAEAKKDGDEKRADSGTKTQE